MNKRALRSIVAIPTGYVVMLGGYVATMVVVAIACGNPFRAGVPFAIGWFLVALGVGFVWSIIGGFATSAIAQRREVAHAIGLVLFTELVSLCFLGERKSAISIPIWHMITGQVSMVSGILLGGWLRIRQDILVSKIPPSVIRTIGYFRFPVAVTVSVLTFVISTYLGVLLGGAGLWAIWKMSGQKYPPGSLGLLCLIVPAFLSFLLSHWVYRRLMARNSSAMNDPGRG